MLRSDVMAYYRRLGERERLRASAHGRLEFLRTWDLLGRVLPPPPARVLDVGGGTGVYAGPLADAGYLVHLVDPVAEHVADAASRRGVTAAVGDARHLAEPDASVDAVLLLGPLYHLPDRSDRIRTWLEAARVVRPGGMVAAATISRFASALDGFRNGYYAEPGYAALVDRALDSGVHTPGDLPWFTTAYFHGVEEPAVEAAEAGLTGIRVRAIEGPLWLAGRLPEVLGDDAQIEHLLATLRRLEEERSLLGASSHLLTVANRPL